LTRRIMIACPTNSGTLDYSTSLTIGRATMEAAQRGWETDTVFRVKDSMITRARNVLFSMFYASECTDLFFIDDDVACAPGSFARLMDHPVEVVGGSYRSRRGDKEEYVLKPLPNCMLELDQRQKTGLMEVEAAATGFLRITRAAAETMVSGYPDLWFHDSTAPEGLKVYCFFDFQLIDHVYWSEDYTFCRRFRDIGGKVWIDPFLTLTHTGKDAWRGQLLEYLKRSNAQVEAEAAAAPAPNGGSVLDAAKAYLKNGGGPAAGQEAAA
jgi:hypothetical protein